MTPVVNSPAASRPPPVSPQLLLESEPTSVSRCPSEARRGAARVERSSRNIVTFAKFRLGIGIRLFHCPADPYQ